MAVVLPRSPEETHLAGALTQEHSNGEQGDTSLPACLLLTDWSCPVCLVVCGLGSACGLGRELPWPEGAGGTRTLTEGHTIIGRKGNPWPAIIQLLHYARLPRGHASIHPPRGLFFRPQVPNPPFHIACASPYIYAVHRPRSTSRSSGLAGVAVLASIHGEKRMHEAGAYTTEVRG